MWQVGLTDGVRKVVLFRTVRADIAQYVLRDLVALFPGLFICWFESRGRPWGSSYVQCEFDFVALCRNERALTYCLDECSAVFRRNGET